MISYFNTKYNVNIDGIICTLVRYTEFHNHTLDDPLHYVNLNLSLNRGAHDM